MKFGAMNFPVTPLLDEIDTFSLLGFDYLELTMDPPMAHYTVLAEIKGDILTALRANNLGLICHLPTFVSTADLTESIRDASIMEMQKSLAMASELGAEKVVLHPSAVVGMGGFVLGTVRDYALAFLSEISDTARSLNVTICLENMFPRNMFGVEPIEFEGLFRLFPTIKLTLDTGHANIAENKNNRLMKLVEQFGDRIGHLHFSDNNGYRDDHLAIGEGSINFKRLIKSLKEIGYDDTITLEVFDQNRQALVDSRQRIIKLFHSV